MVGSINMENKNNIIDVVKTLLDLKVFVYVEAGKLKTKAENSAITPTVISLIKTHKLELINYFTELEQNDNQVPLVTATANKVDDPLSYSQQRLWLLDQIEGENAHYNMQHPIKLTGVLDFHALEKAFKTIVERHESLRTTFYLSKNNEPRQLLQSTENFCIPIYDLSSKDTDKQNSEIDAFVMNEAQKPFNLNSDFLLRVQLLKKSTQEHIILVSMHHIASDGWSMGLLIREFSSLYRAYVKGEENPLPDLSIQYSDYACWQRNWLKDDVLEKLLSYWEKQLANLPSVHSLPLDKPRPAVQTFNGKTQVTTIDSSIYRDFDGLCKKQGASLFMGLHAAFSSILARYSNETDIVLGTAIANREQEEIADLIGFFMNTLVLRCDLSSNPSFNELLEQSKNTLSGAYMHQQVPFDQIVERLQPERSLSYGPLFQVMLVLQNNERGELELPSLTLSQVETEANTAKFDLALNVAESPEGLMLYWAFNTDLFNESTINRLAEHFGTLVNSLVGAPDKPIFSLEVLTEQEVEHQLVNCNNTSAAHTDNSCVHTLFEKQVLLTPDKVALTFNNVQLTYRALNERANQVAYYLKAKCDVNPDSLVGVCLERSVEMIIAMLGVLKAGAGYIPLDPSYPAARLSYMINDAELNTIISNQLLSINLSFDEPYVVCLDETKVQDTLVSLPSDNLNIIGLSPSNLAYVIYTSGSTGHPKGVMIEHQSIVNFLFSMAERPGINRTDTLLSVTSTSFDIHGLEIFLPLLNGAETILASTAQTNDPEQLIAMIEKHNVSIMQATPATWKMLIDTNWSPTQKVKVLCGGEALSQSLASTLLALPKVDLWNMYGPTETTIWSCIQKIESHTQPISIGKAIRNTQVYVMGLGGSLVPTGTPGELLIGGNGLARGYKGCPELTAEKFIDNPYYDPTIEGSSKRLYRTGDLTRWLDDGSLEYLGRIDQQVKLRGFRVELGEIEHTLISHVSVQDAVVSFDDSSKEKRLLAYVVLSDYESTDKRMIESEAIKEVNSDSIEYSLRKRLRDTLPPYMQPYQIRFMNALPLTPNNKIDKQALPKFDLTEIQSEYVAPNTESERLLCALCQEILELDKVGVTDNFFALGGHSLMVIKLVSRLKQEGVDIHIHNVFSANSIKSLAEQIEHCTNNVEMSTAVTKSLIPKGCTNIIPEMLSLVNLSENDISQIVEVIPGGANNIEDIYPLSPLQEGILFHYIMDKDVDPFISSTIFKVHNKKALNQLIDGLNFIIARYDILRTAVIWQGISLPVQVVCREVKMPVEFIELAEGEDGLSFIEAHSLSSRKMELSSAPLLGLKVAQTSDNGPYYISLLAHHMNLDNVGLELVQKELMYYFNGKQAELPEALPYRKVIEQLNQQNSDIEASQFFKKQLKGIDEPTTPFDLVDITGDGLDIDEVYYPLPSHIGDELRQVAKEFNVSPAILFHAAWSLVISACSGKEDVVFGTVLSGRMRSPIEVERMLGLFMNTLPLRINMVHSSVVDLLKDIQQSLNELLMYEQTPLALAVKCSELPNDKPLFSAILNYRHAFNAVHSSGVSNVHLGIEATKGIERANYPFSMIIDDFGDDFALKVQVDNSISANRIAIYMQNALIEIIRGLSTDTSIKVSELSIVTLDEVNELLALNHVQKNSLIEEHYFHRTFEKVVEENPGAQAVLTPNCDLTYSQLNIKSNKLAHYLNDLEITEGSRVGIFVKRSAETLISILGILKAGATYVPLDVSYPAQRVEYIVEDSEIELVLLNKDDINNSAISGVDILLMDNAATDPQWLFDYSEDNFNRDEDVYQPQRQAYILYTSGSTGNPKGVIVSCSALQNYLDYAKGSYWHLEMVGSVVSSSLSFDATITTALTPLLIGKSVSMVSEGEASLSELSEYMFNSEERLFKLTPAHLEALAYKLIHSDQVNPAVHKIIVGGEQLLTYTLLKWNQKWLPNAIFVNEYGPTETVVGCATYTVQGTYENISKDSVVPIGKAISNMQLYVVDKHCRLLPKGVSGELLIGGKSVSQGYIGNINLTKEKFIRNPFYEKSITDSSDLVYRAGDMVRWGKGDNLEFISRVDDQVKIHGFRIEPREIEQQLLCYKEVNNAVVTVKTNEEGEKRLVAYVTHKNAQHMLSLEDDSITLRNELIESLRNKLSLVLPEYMMPSAFVILETLPLTSNGKIDRKNLPEPDISLQQKIYVVPTTELEKFLCNLWQEVLDLEQVGVTDNFFELGGHSLLLIKMIAKAQQQGVLIDVQDFFNYPQLSILASELDKKKDSDITEFVVPENHIPKDCQQITPDMLPLISLSQEEINHISSQIPGGVENIQDIYPLGPLQNGILYTHRLIDRSDPYIISTVYEMKNKTVLDNFIQAIQYIVDRHDVLRTAILWEGFSEPLQVVCKQMKLPVGWLELENNDDVSNQVQKWLLPEKHWMDLTHAPLIKLTVANKPNSDQFVAILQHHHIVSDNVGLQIIQREVIEYCEGRASELPDAVPYRNFIAHTLHLAQERDAKSYFTNLLGDIDEPTSPFGLLDTKDEVTPIVELREVVPDDVSSKIRSLSKSLKVTPASLFYSAFGALIALCSGRDEVVFGSVMSGRLQGTVGSEVTLGVFINTLPIRLNTNDISVVDYVLDTQKRLLELLPFEQAPLALAQSCSGLENDIPLINCMFNYRHSKLIKSSSDNFIEGEQASITLLGEQERDNYPLNIHVDDFGSRFELDVQVETSVDVKKVMSYMQTALAQLVNNLETDPKKCVNELPILPESEAYQELVPWNETEADYPRESCIHHFFEEQTQINPENIALVFQGQQLSYAQLNNRANQLAHLLLKEKNIKADQLVGIYAERSVEMVVAILAILKAGGAYLPLDPEYPNGRIQHIINDAELTTIITQKKLLARGVLRNEDVLCVDDIDTVDKLAIQPIENIVKDHNSSRQLAYVIYTSGSTGKPKGVMVEHQALVNRIDWMNKEYGCTLNDRFLQKTPFSFDVSVWEFLWPLSYGAGLVIAKPHGHKDPMYISSLIEKEKITKIHFVPSMLSSMMSLGNLSQCVSLQQVFCSGEVLSLKNVAKFKSLCPQSELHNLYGPTEAAIDVSYWNCYQDLDGYNSVPIGRPIQNIQLKVVNSHLMDVPQGVPGELLISGTGLARGYLNNSFLTEQKFISSIKSGFNSEGTDRFYRTGDLVRWLPDGNLEYIGRIDHQVKVRGFRIEIGEIESVILENQLVREAVVVVNQLPEDNSHLLAYIVSEGVKSSTEQASLIDTLRNHCLELLPDYMLPTKFIFLDTISLTGNGKVDRNSLPKIKPVQGLLSYVKPKTKLEQELCELLQALLEIELVGISDDFFAIGGNSLHLMRFVASANKQGIPITVADVWKLKSIDKLCKNLNSSNVRIS